jgi:large subunit ribosomal protein L7/L12
MNEIELIINKINNISILDLNILLNKLQNKFKFEMSSSEPFQVKEDIEVTSKSKFKLILISIKPDKKISVLKTVKLLLNLGLKESKDLIDNVPSIIKEDITLEEIDELKTQLENAGGVINIEKMTEL